MKRKKHSPERDQLVQERTTNHPSLRELSSGALCVLRAVTISTPNADPQLALAYLDLPCGTAIRSNCGVIVDVDLKSGQLKHARLHRDMDKAVTAHPDTGKTIAGGCLPEWRHCISLLEKAHRYIPGARCLAWDLGFSPAGPVILEVNAGFAVDEFQRLMQQPVGQTALGTALDELIKHLGNPQDS
jgi:hypothetical protein